jgi:hypothetical protein
VTAEFAKFVSDRAPRVANLQMSEIIRFPLRSTESDMIARLVSAGYLQPERRNDPEAITNAIVRMKVDLRSGKGSDNPPAA